ncbi:MAG: hypothetical protein RMZ43_029445 [Nostoc sp. CmiVER01]|uniref:hypothetical protein n=1 Tax=Nostoc sp. CmiVER01 TaxID=3075384 RepID=UPI003A103AE4
MTVWRAIASGELANFQGDYLNIVEVSSDPNHKYLWCVISSADKSSLCSLKLSTKVKKT